MKALHNHLIHRVITEFVARHVRDPRVFDSTNEMDLQALTKSGISLESLALPSDVIVHDRERDWWFLIDATPDRSHISESRKAELTQCFSECEKHLVLISAFSDRESFTLKWFP